VVIGILGAMEEEVGLIRDRVEGAAYDGVGPRIFVTGSLAGQRVVAGISGFGKVASSSTVTSMIDRYRTSAVIFTGVAGGVDPIVRRGDVVVADSLVQHDFDASPIFPRYVIPSLGVSRIVCDPDLAASAAAAARATGHTVHRGLIASGDRFIDDPAEVGQLRIDLPGLLAVEMEGAAVAQVCADRDVPFVVVRAISDSANEDAAGDFTEFVREVSAPMLANIVETMVASI
jgi:adenosylhomocysteine nucleosidase